MWLPRDEVIALGGYGGRYHGWTGQVPTPPPCNQTHVSRPSPKGVPRGEEAPTSCKQKRPTSQQRKSILVTLSPELFLSSYFENFSEQGNHGRRPTLDLVRERVGSFPSSRAVSKVSWLLPTSPPALLVEQRQTAGGVHHRARRKFEARSTAQAKARMPALLSLSRFNVSHVHSHDAGSSACQGVSPAVVLRCHGSCHGVALHLKCTSSDRRGCGRITSCCKVSGPLREFRSFI